MKHAKKRESMALPRKKKQKLPEEIYIWTIKHDFKLTALIMLKNSAQPGQWIINK